MGEMIEKHLVDAITRQFTMLYCMITYSILSINVFVFIYYYYR